METKPHSAPAETDDGNLYFAVQVQELRTGETHHIPRVAVYQSVTAPERFSHVSLSAGTRPKDQWRAGPVQKRPVTVFQLEMGGSPYRFRMFTALPAAQKAGTGSISDRALLSLCQWVPGSPEDPAALRSWLLQREDRPSLNYAIITEYLLEDA